MDAVEKKKFIQKMGVVGLDGAAFSEMAADPDAEIGYFIGMIHNEINYTVGCISVKADPLLRGFETVVHTILATLYSKELITKKEWDDFPTSEGQK
uniref:Uncharacterized protein n=1 Tax=viral metagenome TaxID=1070528 RepID=A0A6M3L0T0_9ZZZZ